MSAITTGQTLIELPLNEKNKIVDMPLELVHEDVEFNCRGAVIPNDVRHLREDIEKRGLLQAVIVREYTPEQKRKHCQDKYPYGLVVGYRRFAAVRLLGWPTIPAAIRYELSDDEARIINLQENFEREDLNLLQEAKAIEKLKWSGMSNREIADRLGKSEGWVQIRTIVLNFQPEIQKACAEGILKQQHVKQIQSFPYAKQIEVVKTLTDKRLRGERGLNIAKPTSSQSKRARNRAEMNALLDHILDNLGASFATRVLAWCVGNITSLELYRDIKQMARERGIAYEIPEDELL